MSQRHQESMHPKHQGGMGEERKGEGALGNCGMLESGRGLGRYTRLVEKKSTYVTGQRGLANQRGCVLEHHSNRHTVSPGARFAARHIPAGVVGKRGVVGVGRRRSCTLSALLSLLLAAGLSPLQPHAVALDCVEEAGDDLVLIHLLCSKVLGHSPQQLLPRRLLHLRLGLQAGRHAGGQEDELG